MFNTKSCCFASYANCENIFFPDGEKRIKEILREDILRMIREDFVTNFISGVQPGIDMLAAETVVELRERYAFLTLECVLASEELANDWPEALRERYFSVIGSCDNEIMLQTKYTPDCLRKMRAYMIKYSDYIITNACEDKCCCIYSCPVTV